MKERPILFSAPMVCAILDGSKTQTRRAVKGMALDWVENAKFNSEFVAHPDNDMCPYGKIGDQLWVRETFSANEFMECSHAASAEAKPPCGWTPSIHMPRWASRIQLEITGVRVERLQDITENDAAAEGFDNSKSATAIELGWYEKPRAAFMRTWDQIYSNWDANPWVWCITFRRVGL